MEPKEQSKNKRKMLKKKSSKKLHSSKLPNPHKFPQSIRNPPSREHREHSYTPKQNDSYRFIKIHKKKIRQMIMNFCGQFMNDQQLESILTTLGYTLFECDEVKNQLFQIQTNLTRQELEKDLCLHNTKNIYRICSKKVPSSYLRSSDLLRRWTSPNAPDIVTSESFSRVYQRSLLSKNSDIGQYIGDKEIQNILAVGLSKEGMISDIEFLGILDKSIKHNKQQDPYEKRMEE